MKNYFQLHFKILNRKLTDFGVPIIIAYTLLPIAFIIFSDVLFEKTEFAFYFYIITAFIFISKLGNQKRNDFLKSIFNKNTYLKIRILENLIYTLPFMLYLIYRQLFFCLIVLMLFSILISLITHKTNFNFTIPTPFGKKPYEYAVGFRKTFYIFPIAYILTFIAASVNNFNLGAFSLFLNCVICFSYYSKLEPDYFIWNFSLTAHDFLLKKVKSCLINFTLLNSIILLTLCLFFIDKIDILIICYVLSCLYLIAIIFAKYSTYPEEMGLHQIFIIFLSLTLPPLVVIIIPFFYKQSVKHLKKVLG